MASSDKDVEAENALLREQLAELKASFTSAKRELRDTVTKAMEEFKALRAREVELKNENDAMLVELEAQDEAYLERVLPPSTPREKVQATRTFLSTQRVLMLEKIASELALKSKEDAVSKVVEQEERLANEVQESAIKLSSLVDIVSTLESDTETLRDAYAAAMANKEDGEMWQTQNAKVQKSMINAEVRIESQTAELGKLEGDIGELAEQRHALETQYAELMATKGHLASDCRTLATINATGREWIAQNEMLKAHTARLNRVIARVSAALEDCKAAGEDGLVDRAQEAAVLGAQFQELAGSTSALRSKLHSVISSTEQLMSRDYQHLNITRDDILSTVQARLAKARLTTSAKATSAKISELRTKVAVQEPKLEALVPRASKVRASLSHLHQLMDTHAELVATRSKLIAARETLCASLKSADPKFEVPPSAVSLGPGPGLVPPAMSPARRAEVETTVANAANETELVDATESRIRRDIAALMVEREQGRARLNLPLMMADGEASVGTSVASADGGSSGSGSGSGSPGSAPRVESGAGADARTVSSAELLDALLAEHETIEDTAFIRFLPDTLESDLPKVKCATLPHLVRQLTFPTYPDTEYLHCFMLTYRSVADPLDVMSLLLERFCVTCPVKLSPDDEAVFEQRVVKPIRLRVLNVLRIWVSTYVQDFFEAPRALAMLTEFMDKVLKVHAPSQYKLFEAITRKYEASLKRIRNMSGLHVVASLPKMSRGRGSSEIKSFDKADIKKLAQAINAHEFSVFGKIQPRECFGLAWSKPGREETSPNVLALVQRFNMMSTWVAATILEAGVGEKSASKAATARARAIKKFISLATTLYELNNFNATMEVIAGLAGNAVYRLSATWAKVDSKALAKKEALESVFSSAKSWKALRERIHAVNPPTIPYLGMYLTDLTFTADGNPSSLDGLINFVKCRRYATILREIQRYQDIGYTDEVDMAHHRWLERAIERATQAYPSADEELYAKSLEVEPRT